MSIALQIPCITRHFYPGTLDKLKQLCALAGFEIAIREQGTCCGLPYFEKGELKAAKSIGEYNLSVFGPDQLICGSTKCHSVYTLKYPKIFNNTVSHNTAVALAKSTLSLADVADKLPDASVEAIAGHYFLVNDCCSSQQSGRITGRLINCRWTMPALHSTCCGAGTSMPAAAHDLAGKMSAKLIEDFLSSGAEAMVFEDDICRKQIDLAAAGAGNQIKTMNIIDLLMSNHS